LRDPAGPKNSYLLLKVLKNLRWPDRISTEFRHPAELRCWIPCNGWFCDSDWRHLRPVAVFLFKSYKEFRL